MKHSEVLVLGVGNILLSDEGAGSKAVEELKRRFALPEGVEVIDGGTLGIELLPYLDNRSHLFIIDAVQSGKGPGTTVRIYLEDPPAYFRTKISPHQIGLSELLAVAAMTDNLPEDIVLFGVEPEKLDTSMQMSNAVSASIDSLVDMVVVELESMGFKMQPVGDAA